LFFVSDNHPQILKYIVLPQPRLLLEEDLYFWISGASFVNARDRAGSGIPFVSLSVFTIITSFLWYLWIAGNPKKWKNISSKRICSISLIPNQVHLLLGKQNCLIALPESILSVKYNFKLEFGFHLTSLDFNGLYLLCRCRATK